MTKPGDDFVTKAVKCIEMDSRIPSRYDAAMSIYFLAMPGGTVKTEIERPQIPFRIRRIVCDAPGFWIEDLRIGNQLEIAIAYPLRIISELLMPDKHPIEWGEEGEKEYGLSTAQVGCNVSLTAINRNKTMQSLHVIFLGKGLW